MRRICIVAETVGSRGCKDLVNCAIPKYMYNIYIYIYIYGQIYIYTNIYIYIYRCASLESRVKACGLKVACFRPRVIDIQEASIHGGPDA